MTTLLNRSLANNTKHAYKAAFNAYRVFHISIYNQEPTRHISSKKFAQFIAFSHSKGMKYSTICSRISALKYINNLYGNRDTSNHFLVQRILQGCKLSANNTDKRKPITKSLLKRIIRSLSSIFDSQYNRLLFKAMFIISFYALLRVSEIAKTQHSNHSILHSDINLKQYKGQVNKIDVVLRHSKHNNSETTIQLHKQSHRKLCPVRAVQKFHNIRAPGDGQFFVNNDGNPITDKQFRKVFSKCITKIGLKPKFYTPHSFRIGGATSAHLKNISDSQIRQLGRWKSNAFLGYIRPSKICW